MCDGSRTENALIWLLTSVKVSIIAILLLQWHLAQAEKVLERFIPALCHESDGLILQVSCVGDGANLQLTVA